jgi:hypothetical protein
MHRRSADILGVALEQWLDEAAEEPIASTTPQWPNDLLSVQWRGFQQLAKTLPNRKILSVELSRTDHDETTAIFTVVKDGEPVRYVVVRDSHGNVKPTPEAASAEAGSPLLPGLIAVATEMLSAAFDAEATAQLFAPLLPV